MFRSSYVCGQNRQSHRQTDTLTDTQIDIHFHPKKQKTTTTSQNPVGQSWAVLITVYSRLLFKDNPKIQQETTILS